MATYEQKQSYLDILAVFHYVMGGLSALFCAVALAFLGIGLGAATEWGEAVDAEAGCALVAIMFFVLVVAGGYALINLLAGRALRRRRAPWRSRTRGRPSPRSTAAAPRPRRRRTAGTPPRGPSGRAGGRARRA